MIYILAPKLSFKAMAQCWSTQDVKSNYRRVTTAKLKAIQDLLCGTTLFRSGSVIDEDYNGEIHVKLFNMSVIPHIIQVGDCIAQLVVQPYANLNLSRGFEQ